MAIHRKLSKSYQEAVADVAQLALSTARSLQTATNGTISVSNGDGTTTVIGVGAGTDETGASNGTAYFVGDTTPPGAPEGVAFVTGNGCITGVWGGSLDGGVPADFDHVAFRIGGAEFGEVNVAGSAMSGELVAGTTYECDAVAYDVQGNVSDPCDAVEVTVVDAAAEATAAAEAAQEAADEAADAAQAAADAADALASTVTDVQATVTDLSTTVTGVAETATEALELATSVETSLEGFEVDVSETYATKNEVSEVEDAADAANELAASAYSAATALYGTCEDSAGTNVKSVDCEGFELFDGAAINVLFVNGNTSASFMLYVADATDDAIIVYASGSATGDDNYLLIGPNTTVRFVYLDGCWTYAGGVTSYNLTIDAALGDSIVALIEENRVVANGTDVFTMWENGCASSEGSLYFGYPSGLAQEVWYGDEPASEDNPFELDAGDTVALVYCGDHWSVEDATALKRNASLSVTVDSVSATASSAYTTASTALTNAAAAQLTADAITTKVEENYTTTEDLEDMLGDYVTDSTLSNTLENYSTTEQTAEMIASEVTSALYTTDSSGNTTAIYATTSEVTQTAGEILAEVSASYVSSTDLSTTLEDYSTTDQTAKAITSAVTSALYTTDDDGNSTAIYATTSEVEQTATDITTTFTSSTGSNLLTDPGFESTAYGGTLPSGFAYSTSDPHSGAYCMACTGAGTRYYFNHAYGDPTDPVAITVEPGETYVYSMYYKISSSSANWATDNMKLRVATADGNDTLICSHSTSSIGTDWTQITGTWTNSAGYTEVYVMVATSVTSGTVYVDDAFFGPSVASGTLIRESSDGVEVAKYSGSSYSTTRTLMAADGFHVQDSGGTDLTVVDSDGMTVYADGSTAAEFTADSVVLGANFSRPLYITASDTMTLVHPRLSDGFAGLQIGQEDSTPTSYLSASQDSGQGLFSAAAFDSIVSAAVLAKAAGDLGDGYASVSCAVTTDGSTVSIISDEFSASVDDAYFYTDEFSVSGSKVIVTHDDTGFKHVHSNSGYGLSVGVGSNGYNRGIYDSTEGRWIAYADSDGKTLLQDNDGIGLVSGAMFPIGVAATASSSSATIGLNIYLEGAQNYGYVPVLVCSGRVCAFVLFAGTSATSSFTSVSSSNYTILASGTYVSGISFLTDSSYDDCVRLKFTFSQTSSSASGAVVYSLRPNVIRVAKVAWTSS